MNGLQLSRMFFFEWGLPFLLRSFPQLIDQIAAGTFNGSHTLEADDELSRDHAWGPRFALYLPTESAAHWKIPLEQALNTAASKRFAATNQGDVVTVLRGQQEPRINVASINQVSSRQQIGLPGLFGREKTEKLASLLFKFHGTHILERGMSANPMVKTFEIFKDALLGLLPGSKPPTIYTRAFEGAEKVG